MTKSTHNFVIMMVVALVVLVAATLSSSYSQATGSIGVQAITTPSLSTSTSYTATSISVISTSVSTTTTSFYTSQTSTTTITTTISTSWSYTSTHSTTTTNASTYTSYAGISQTVPTTTTMFGITSQTLTSTSTFTSSTTVAAIPGCLIATATFGSELAPEVQLLRSFRDDAILGTAAGSAFMAAFNAWYYSFSPGVAGYLYTHPDAQAGMRLVLYPLIGILKLSYLTFSSASAFPELAAVLSGLVASSLIGAIYLGLPLSLIRVKVKRLRGTGAKFEKSLAYGLLLSLTVLLAGEMLGEQTTMAWSAVATVLTALFLSASVTSARISRRLQASRPQQATLA